MSKTLVGKRDFCNPTRGCRCPILHVFHDEHGAYEANVVETDVPGIEMLVDLSKFDTPEALAEAVTKFVNSISKFNGELSEEVFVMRSSPKD